MRARGVPKSGIPSQDSLKVAEGALPDSTLGLGSVDAIQEMYVAHAQEAIDKALS